MLGFLLVGSHKDKDIRVTLRNGESHTLQSVVNNGHFSWITFYGDKYPWGYDKKNFKCNGVPQMDVIEISFSERFKKKHPLVAKLTKLFLKSTDK